MGVWGDFKSYASDALGFSKPAAINTAGKEIAENDQRRQEYANKLNNYQDRQAPQLHGASVGPTAQATMPGYVAPERSQGAAGFLPGQAQAGQAAGTQLEQIQPITKAKLDYSVAARSGAAAAGQGQAQQVDTGGALKEQQAAGLDTLKQAALGQAPSAAEEQMKRGMAANIASQYAMARTAHGAGRVGALENAQSNEEQINNQAVGAAAELRAGEQAQARGQYAQQLNAVRGQDIGAQTTNAQLGTQTSLANAAANTDVSKFNTSTDADTARFNAGQANQRSLQQGAYDQEAAMKQFDAQNQRNIEQGRIGSTERMFNAGQQTGTSQFNAGQQSDVQKFLAGLGQNNQQFNAQQGNEQQRYFAGLGAQVGMYNAGQSNEMGRAQGNLDFQGQQSNADFQTRWAQMDDAQKQAYLNYISQSQGQSIQGAIGQAGAQQAASDARHKGFMDLVNTGKSFATGQALGG